MRGFDQLRTTDFLVSLRAKLGNDQFPVIICQEHAATISNRKDIAMPDRPKLCIQALRVESDDKYDTYYGYFWDHPTGRWKLYAAGRKWNRGKAKEHLSPGSFCEIPGPPQVQRSGDRVREVRRRGWHFSKDKRRLHATERKSAVSQSTQADDRSWSHNS